MELSLTKVIVNNLYAMYNVYIVMYFYTILCTNVQIIHIFMSNKQNLKRDILLFLYILKIYYDLQLCQTFANNNSSHSCNNLNLREHKYTIWIFFLLVLFSHSWNKIKERYSIKFYVSVFNCRNYMKHYFARKMSSIKVNR